ncbi:MAG: CPBP family intramembrane metalloprotease [Chlorobi bacterium]|nr:CPBP family intramembrane metalloprotease [Chlorobiota bacterium]MCI0716862.1 CPBP family intramembrane metalloprotease [Chlorobiota bacterium]
MQEFDPEKHKDQQEPPGSFLRNLNPFAYSIIVLAVIFFLYQFIGGALALAAGDLDIENPDVKTTRIILAFSQYMLMLAPTIFFARFQTFDLKSVFKLSYPKPSLVFLAVLGIVLIQPFLQGYMYVQEQVINGIPFIKETIRPVKEIFDLFEKTTLKIVHAHSLVEFIVVVIVIAVTPAICEEALFRGFVLTNVSKATRKAGAAVFLSAFLFAVYHFQPFNIVPLIVLGWYLGFVVYYANSIWVGVICHFLNNFIASYALFIYGKDELETPNLTGDEMTNTIAAALVSLVLFTGTIVIYYRLRENKLSGGSAGE